jgi:hypothetical protein
MKGSDDRIQKLERFKKYCGRFGARIFGFWRGFGDGAGLQNTVTELKRLVRRSPCPAIALATADWRRRKPKTKKTASSILLSEWLQGFFDRSGALFTFIQCDCRPQRPAVFSNFIKVNKGQLKSIKVNQTDPPPGEQPSPRPPTLDPSPQNTHHGLTTYPTIQKSNNPGPLISSAPGPNKTRHLPATARSTKQ